MQIFSDCPMHEKGVVSRHSITALKDRVGKIFESLFPGVPSDSNIMMTAWFVSYETMRRIDTTPWRTQDDIALDRLKAEDLEHWISNVKDEHAEKMLLRNRYMPKDSVTRGGPKPVSPHFAHFKDKFMGGSSSRKRKSDDIEQDSEDDDMLSE